MSLNMEPLPVVPVNKISESNILAESSKDNITSKPNVLSSINEDKKTMETSHSTAMKRSMSELDQKFGNSKKPICSSQSFPSLSDHVLRQLGLWLEETQPTISLSEAQNEKDVENNFVALMLAFQTDRLTLTSRLDLQTRLRDQAEQNMTNEIQLLQNIVTKLCDKCDYLSDIQSQIDALHKAALRVSSAAEIFGAVQQENRLSKAVDVILQHVENLKNAYKKEKNDHIETKKFLTENKQAINSQITFVKPICRRRATIAVGVAQNETNSTQDIIIPHKPLESTQISSTGRSKQRHSLVQRGSSGKIENAITTEILHDIPVENSLERRHSSHSSNILTSFIDENACLHHSCYGSQFDSDSANDSDGSRKSSSAIKPKTKWINHKDFRFSLKMPCLPKWSMDDVFLFVRYCVAAALLFTAFVIFCSTLYL